jgi:phenylacetate-coenzyme A ligase PaaK-like adenylate-forming protein
MINMVNNTDNKEKLHLVLESVRKCPFYRSKNIDVRAWESVPYLAREDIVNTCFWDRVCSDNKDVPVIRHTYGSSGKRILITPRNSYGDYSDPYITMSMDRTMCFFASAHNECPREQVSHVQMFFGDVGNLEMSAKIMKEAQINSLSITPYTALVLSELLVNEGIIDCMRNVMLIGERCSTLQYEKIKKLYKNACVFGTFASSETREIVALPCLHDRTQGGSLVLESIPEFYCEVVDVNTGKIIIEPGVPGELVITTLKTDIPFPLIRYRTGDVASIVSRTCGCDKQRIGFEVLGRLSVFPVRMVKGELTVSAAEEALSKADGLSSSYFEIHYTEEILRDKVLPRVVIKVFAEKSGLTEEKIETDISGKLKVFPTYTYLQGVEDGIYLPLKIFFLPSIPPGPLGKPKTPIVVRHVRGGAKKEMQEIPVEYVR